MARTISGDFGQATFATAATDAGGVTGRYLTLNTEAALNFFQGISIVKSNILLNEMGLFTFQQAGRDGEVRFANISTPKHLLTARKNGCTWISKGKIQFSTKSFDLCAVEYNGEQCPDTLYGTCLERILGPGNEKRDLLSTPEGQALFAEMVNRIYEGLGNSFYDLAFYGQHPLIEQADTNDWYTVEDEEWADYKDQQEACGGLMTLIDEYKAQGHPQYNVDIFDAELSADRSQFIGTATDVFDRVINAQNTAMKLLSKRNNASQNGRMQRAVILCDTRIFAKYEQELSIQWNHMDAQFQYYLNGEYCAAVGCDSTAPMRGVLRYKGHMIVCMDEWQEFDEMLGINTYRVMAVTPGVFAMGYDVPGLSQFDGLGLQILQRLDAPFKGKVYMDTTFKMRPSIINEDYIVNASRVFTPA
jgi:hypothetical protein